MFSAFSFQDFFSCFFVLFAIIDLPGAIPIILNLRKKGKTVNSTKTALLALVMFFVFFYVGDAFLSLFGVDIASFAIAGSLIIFVMAITYLLLWVVYPLHPYLVCPLQFLAELQKVLYALNPLLKLL